MVSILCHQTKRAGDVRLITGVVNFIAVAAENITLNETPQPVKHLQIGAFFSRFEAEKGYYVPNLDTQRRYPDDVITEEDRL